MKTWKMRSKNSSVMARGKPYCDFVTMKFCSHDVQLACVAFRVRLNLPKASGLENISWVDSKLDRLDRIFQVSLEDDRYRPRRQSFLQRAA